MSLIYRHILPVLLIAMAIGAKAQQQNLPLNREFNLVNQKVFDGFNNNVHSSFHPINPSLFHLDSISGISKSEQNYYGINISKSEQKSSRFFKWIYGSMFFDNLFVVDTGQFYLTVDPLFNIEMGKDSEDISEETLYKNTRGIMIRSTIGKKFSLETSFYENQAVLPDYLTNYSDEHLVIPGQGRWKKFKTDQGYDFSSAAANLSYTPTDYINFQLGTGKNFVGDGYRSLLLSDASSNYPFWKIIATFGKKDQFQYTKLNASLSSVTRREEGSTPEPLFQRKTMSTHYLSWLATKWLNVGLFESTLWQTEDSNGTKPLQFQQFNPIIGVNTITTGFNDVNHSVVGTNLKIKLPFKAVIYNQFVYDGSSRLGYQVGIKYFGISNLTLQAEYNVVEPNTYTSDVTLQSYTNYNEPLAHQLGNNFKEAVIILNYKFKRIFTQVKWTNANTEYEEINQVVDPFGASIGTVSTSYTGTITTLQFHLGLLINPKNNMSLVLGVNQRMKEVSNAIEVENTDYFYVGFRTSLRNLYDDF